MEEIPPPYDVENFNIEKRVRVEQEEDPDLKVKKPAFLVGVPRFSETVKGNNNLNFSDTRRRWRWAYHP